MNPSAVDLANSTLAERHPELAGAAVVLIICLSMCFGFILALWKINNKTQDRNTNTLAKAIETAVATQAAAYVEAAKITDQWIKRHEALEHGQFAVVQEVKESSDRTEVKVDTLRGDLTRVEQKVDRVSERVDGLACQRPHVVPLPVINSADPGPKAQRGR